MKKFLTVRMREISGNGASFLFFGLEKPAQRFRTLDEHNSPSIARLSHGVPKYIQEVQS
jgi:hypothetical protein